MIGAKSLRTSCAPGHRESMQLAAFRKFRQTDTRSDSASPAQALPSNGVGGSTKMVASNSEHHEKRGVVDGTSVRWS